MAEAWRRCSACKEPIGLSAIYWVCSVSTCNRKRTGLVFCSVDCWEIHLPTERHREAWAVEARATDRAEPEPTSSTPGAAKRAGASAATASEPPESQGRKIIRRRPSGEERAVTASGSSAERSSTGSARSPATRATESPEGEILVVASKLKQYVRDRSGFNTSERVLPLLSEKLRRLCDEAIRKARAAEQRTVMGRDVPRE